MKKIGLLAVLALFLLPSTVFALAITVVPPENSVQVGDLFDVELYLGFSYGERVTAWDLHFGFDDTILSMQGPAEVNTLTWMGTPAPDGLAGFSPNPFAGVQSSDPLLLATITFEAVGIGISDLTASYSYTGEGFRGFSNENMYPLPMSLLASITNSSVVVDAAPIPEPATIFLLGTGLVGVIGLRRKR